MSHMTLKDLNLNCFGYYAEDCNSILSGIENAKRIYDQTEKIQRTHPSLLSIKFSFLIPVCNLFLNRTAKNAFGVSAFAFARLPSLFVAFTNATVGIFMSGECRGTKIESNDKGKAKLLFYFQISEGVEAKLRKYHQQFKNERV